MPEKKTAVEILSILVERVRGIESEAGKVAAVLERMRNVAAPPAPAPSSAPPAARRPASSMRARSPA